MNKSDIASFLKEHRKKKEEGYPRDSERKGYSSRSRDEPYEKPSNTIMVSGLPSDITEGEIKLGLDDWRANYMAVRLIKDRRYGINKVIALVEFIAVKDAKDLMEDTRGELYVAGYYGKLTYRYNVKEEFDRYESEKINSWKYEKPTSTVMLRGVSNTLGDNEVRSYISDVTNHVIDVRLIRDKQTGKPRGYGFVEFDSVSAAQRWMEQQQGHFVMENVEMQLSYTSTRQMGKQLSEYVSADSGDWSCARCGGHNFKRRDFCYKCHLSKCQSKSVMETIDGKDQIGTSPCNTLILRDLDALTMEDSIITSLKSRFNCNVTKCKIMRDDITKVSRCFAFVELSSLSESRRIVEYYDDHRGKEFELSGKLITIDYAKNNFTTLMSSYKEALNKRSEETFGGPEHVTSHYDANTAAAAVAQAALNHKKMKHKKGSGSSTSVMLPSNVTVDSSFELIVNGQRRTSVPTNPFTVATINTSHFITPDTSTFLYDQSTQYHFDPITGLYYDTKSQYFFDRLSQQYLYWDQSKKNYVLVEMPTKPDKRELTLHKDGKKSKVTEAKKAAKEMERWEIMMDSKNDRQSQNIATKSDKASSRDRRYTAVDSGLAMLPSVIPSDYCTVSGEERSTFMRVADDLVAAYNSSGSDSDDVVITGTSMAPGSITRQSSVVCLLKKEEEKFINYEKIACLLCNRGFKDRATLDRHRLVSDLHKKNLGQLRDKLGIEDNYEPLSSTKKPTKMRYRDRAKERREKFGVRSVPHKRRYTRVGQGKEEMDGSEEYLGPREGGGALSLGTTMTMREEDNNIGSRLMSKMGWQQGQGLGKQNQGRTDIIQPEFVARGAGIGAAAKFQSTPSDNYRDNLKRAMYAKYHDE